MSTQEGCLLKSSDCDTAMSGHQSAAATSEPNGAAVSGGSCHTTTTTGSTTGRATGPSQDQHDDGDGPESSSPTVAMNHRKRPTSNSSSSDGDDDARNPNIFPSLDDITVAASNTALFTEARNEIDTTGSSATLVAAATAAAAAALISTSVTTNNVEEGEENTTATGTCTTHHDETNRSTKKQKTIRRRSFAPTAREYLKQARNYRNGGKRNAATGSETLEFTYLPRPEWCHMVLSLIATDLLPKNNEIDLHSWIIRVANTYQTLIVGCTHDYHDAVITRDGITRYAQYFPNPDKLEAFHSHIQCHAIYFDDDEYMWKTTRIEPTTTATITTNNNNSTLENEDVDDWNNNNSINSINSSSNCSSISNKNHTMSSAATPENRHDNLFVTYDTLIHPPPRYSRQTFGKDEDTILHMAIKDNATVIAMDIIRIEYKTFLDTVCRFEGYAKNLIFLTLLQSHNAKGITPIIIAAQKGNLIVVEELLRCGAWYWVAAPNDTTAILQAAHFGHTKVIECIVNHYQRHCSCEPDEHFRFPKALDELIDKPSSNGTTPLMRAAQEGHVSTVKFLLKYHAYVNERNNAQMTPLMLAAQRGHAPICRLLINHGANVNRTTNKNTTALFLAAKRGHVAVVKELVTASCDLHQRDNRNRTALQIVQRRMLRRQAALPEPNPPQLPPHHRAPRRHGPSNRTNNDNHENREDNPNGNDGDATAADDDENGNNRINLVSLRADQKLLYLLNPEHQMELIQYAVRVQRNFELIRMYTLIQQNRADVKIGFGFTRDVPTIVKWLSKVTGDPTESDDPDIDIYPDYPYSPHRSSQQLASLVTVTLDDSSQQALIRTMLLPAPLIQTIALFLPLPPLWNERIDRIRSLYHENHPNTALVYALDIIDEILEEGGFLSALETANIPAPLPHVTWYDWKRSAKRTSTTDPGDGTGTRRTPSPAQTAAAAAATAAAAVQRPLSSRRITESVPPRPHDESNPTMCELRRLVGYLPLLQQYQSHTAIVKILRGDPYRMSESLVRPLIHVADVASLCRRCCCLPPTAESGMSPPFVVVPVVPVVPPPHHPGPATPPTTPVISFHSDVALRMLDLAMELSNWYESERHVTAVL